MLLPSKYENLNFTPLVISAYIIRELKKEPTDLESLYNKLKKQYKINLNILYDTVLFLWLADIIYLDKYQIRIK